MSSKTNINIGIDRNYNVLFWDYEHDLGIPLREILRCI